jgi:transcriptional regulator of arginine metabolism
MTAKPRRQLIIRDLLAQGDIPNQERLAELLRSRGLQVTQATLSRDLHELGVVKGNAGYSLPNQPNGHAHDAASLERALKEFLIRGDTGGNLAVLHTGPGSAPLLALEIDKASMKPVLGTVAGDDTVFVATRSPRDAGKLLTRFKELAGLR